MVIGNWWRSCGSGWTYDDECRCTDQLFVRSSFHRGGWCRVQMTNEYTDRRKRTKNTITIKNMSQHGDSWRDTSHNGYDSDSLQSSRSSPAREAGRLSLELIVGEDWTDHCFLCVGHRWTKTERRTQVTGWANHREEGCDECDK